MSPTNFLTRTYRRLAPAGFRTWLGKIRQRNQLAKVDAYRELMKPIHAGHVLITCPELEGQFWIDVRSDILRRISVNREYEPEVTRCIVQHLRPGADFVDIGANVGFFSVHAGLQPTWKGRILAIDPNPSAVELLMRNVAHNKLESIIVAEQIAATSIATELKLTMYEGREEYSTVTDDDHPSVKGAQSSQITVKGKPVDAVVEQHQLSPGLIKIDAEGAELDVISGLKNTIDRCRPTIICEVGGGTYQTGVNQLYATLLDLDYSVHNLSGHPVEADQNFVGEIVAKPITE